MSFRKRVYWIVCLSVAMALVAAGVTMTTDIIPAKTFRAIMTFGAPGQIDDGVQLGNAEAAGPPGRELIQLPLRWCAVRGSDGADNPGSVGEPTTNDYLWRRHERASDRVWLFNNTYITFRSAFTAAIGASASFPIIPDPRPLGPGVEGDILNPQIDDTELREAWAACDAHWDALAKAKGVPLIGFPAVNHHNFVDASGNPGFLKGWGAFNYTAGGTVDICTNPPSISTSAFTWSGRIGVADYSVIRKPDPSTAEDRDAILIAHELGHSLSLDHGNGRDDNGNGRYDRFCDPSENDVASPFTFMTPNERGGSSTKLVELLQLETARAIARRVAGAQIDPPAALINADTVSDQRTDAVRDVSAQDVDLASVAFADVPSTRTSVISHLLFGPIPREMLENQYLFFADLDNDVTTGGTPADLGFKTGFKGAELVTRVVVRPGHVATATVWIFQGGAFQEVKRDFRAAVSILTEGETNQPVSALVTLGVPNAVRGPMATNIRIQAIAEQLQGDQEFDILPNEPSDGFVRMHLVPPIFPVCAVAPPQANPGDTVTIEVSGLLPDKMAHVVLGDVLVATGQTDAKGDANIQLALPDDTRFGPRLVTVGIDGTALTADCLVEIRD
jgi:hypothetical protein